MNLQDTMILLAIAVAAGGGACIGAALGVYLGSKAMVAAVKRAFLDEPDEMV